MLLFVTAVEIRNSRVRQGGGEEEMFSRDLLEVTHLHFASEDVLINASIDGTALLDRRQEVYEGPGCALRNNVSLRNTSEGRREADDESMKSLVMEAFIRNQESLKIHVRSKQNCRFSNAYPVYQVLETLSQPTSRFDDTYIEKYCARRWVHRKFSI